MTNSTEALFSPGSIGTMTVKNRVAMPPMATNYATWTGAVTDRMIRYYSERAKGGAGLITVEFSYIHPSGRIAFYTLGVHEDSLLPGLGRLAEAVHAEGAKISIMIAHGGRRCRSAITGIQPMGPSPMPCLGGETPREMSSADIDMVISWFADAARRVRQAGFDAVTLQLTGGYLLESFISPFSNHRLDGYGGNLEHRMRLTLEVLEAVRQEVGSGFPIICRLCIDEFQEGGLTLSEGKLVAKLLEQAGADAIDTIAGIPETMHVVAPPMALPRGFLVQHARSIKQAVGIPVFAVGRISDPLLAEKTLQEGSADFIDMGRSLLADPDLPNKAREGRFDDIRPCIACNEGCFQRLYSQLDITCVTNPRAGRESLFPAEPAERPKRVLVVGGGPAGMMAALTAANRGHQVVLYERGDRLGGQLLMGCMPPHKEEIHTLVDYLECQIAKSGIETWLQTTVTKELIRETDAEVVIVATGSKPVELHIPVVDARIVSAWDVLAEKETTGSNVVVIGGGEVGCELAELLATQGKEVVILEVMPDIATNMEPRGRTLLLERLRTLGVRVLAKSAICEVRGTTVLYEQGGLRNRIDGVDSVVCSVGSAPNNMLGQAQKEGEVEIHFIGDCVKPRRILEAIREGFELAYAI